MRSSPLPLFRLNLVSTQLSKYLWSVRVVHKLNSTPHNRIMQPYCSTVKKRQDQDEHKRSMKLKTITSKAYRSGYEDDERKIRVPNILRYIWKMTVMVFLLCQRQFCGNYSSLILEYMRLAPRLFSQEPVAWPAFHFTAPARRLTRRNDKAHATISFHSFCPA